VRPVKADSPLARLLHFRGERDARSLVAVAPRA
jgi:hypothetical protein